MNVSLIDIKYLFLDYIIRLVSKNDKTSFFVHQPRIF